MTRLAIAPLAFGLFAAGTTPAGAQDPPVQQAQEQTETDKAEPSFAGKWTMSMQTSNGAFAATLEIALDEKAEPVKVSGTISSEMGTYPVYGELDGETMWFAVSPDGSYEIWWYANLKEDGTLAGALDMAGTQVPFTAKRVPEKKDGGGLSPRR